MRLLWSAVNFRLTVFVFRFLQYHKLSNAIAVDNKGSDVKATNDIKKDSKDYRIDDIENEPVEPGSGPLF